MKDGQINLHQLRIFYTVARRLSYSLAAQELFISQPAVSRQVANLERSLKVRLFERQGRQISLSDAGRLVYDFAEQVFALTDDLWRSLAELQGLERGHLRLAAIDTIARYILPPIIASYQQRHPKVALSLKVAPGPEVIQRLLSDEADIGLIAGPLSEPNLQWQPFGGDELVLIAPAIHSPAAEYPGNGAGISRATLILPQVGSADRSLIESRLEDLGVKPGAIIEMSDTEAIKAAVEAKAGLGFVSRLALSKEGVNSPSTIVEVPGFRVERQLGIVMLKGRHPSRAALAFAAFLHKAALTSLEPEENGG